MVDSRSAPIERCHFAALLPLMMLFVAGVPAMAADSIEELLNEDEVDGHNDALRRDLNAFTEEQWQYCFRSPDLEAFELRMVDVGRLVLARIPVGDAEFG
jgi:hypothetical protein